MHNKLQIMKYEREPQRPLLKGIFHLFATLWYLIELPSLISRIPPGLEFPLVIYVLSIIGSFGASTLLHIINWSDSVMVYPQRLDHIMIFVKIAATYYAGISTVMTDINPLVIQVLCVGTLLGMMLRIFFTQASQIVICLPYLIVGWSLILDPDTMLSLLQKIPLGSIIALSAGLSYTIGGYIYMTKYPNPWPRYMGYHEVFHVFTIVGAILFTITIFDHAVPYYVLHR